MPDPSSIYGGYIRASRYSRIKDSDVERALKPYKITLGQVRSKRTNANPGGFGGLSDAEVYRRGVKAVLAKYRRSKGQ